MPVACGAILVALRRVCMCVCVVWRGRSSDWFPPPPPVRPRTDGGAIWSSSAEIGGCTRGCTLGLLAGSDMSSHRDDASDWQVGVLVGVAHHAHGSGGKCGRRCSLAAPGSRTRRTRGGGAAALLGRGPALGPAARDSHERRASRGAVQQGAGCRLAFVKSNSPTGPAALTAVSVERAAAVARVLRGCCACRSCCPRWGRLRGWRGWAGRRPGNGVDAGSH